MSYFTLERRNMVDNQLRTFDVTDRAVLAAMLEVPREAFVPPGSRALAYTDRSVPIPGDGETRVLLPPMVLARLLQALAIEPSNRVLDVAGGTGYSAACLAALGAEVTMRESRADLVAAAETAIQAAGFGALVTVREGALPEGGADDGPFDAILINGAVEDEPTALLGRLVEGGRLACLHAGARTGQARLYVRAGAGCSFRGLFDASAPVLGAFRHPPAFTF